MAIHRGSVALSAASPVAYSTAMATAGHNAVACFTIATELSGSTPTVNLTLQLSFDKINWTESPGPAGSQDIDAVGAASLEPVSALTAPYLRLKFTLTGDSSLLQYVVNLFNT